MPVERACPKKLIRSNNVMQFKTSLMSALTIHPEILAFRKCHPPLPVSHLAIAIPSILPLRPHFQGACTIRQHNEYPPSSAWRLPVSSRRRETRLIRSEVSTSQPSSAVCGRDLSGNNRASYRIRLAFAMIWLEQHLH